MLCFEVGLEIHSTINRSSIDEERVVIFIQKSFCSHFVSVTLLEVLTRNILIRFWDSSQWLHLVCVPCLSLSLLGISTSALYISIKGIHSQLSTFNIRHCICYCVLVNALEFISYAPLWILAFVVHSTKGGARDSSTDRCLLFPLVFSLLLPSPPFQDIWLYVLLTLPRNIKEIPFLIFDVIPLIDLVFDSISQWFSSMFVLPFFKTINALLPTNI